MSKLNANELMIGDWVNLSYKNLITGQEVSTNFQVDQIVRPWRDEPHDVWSKENGNMGKVAYMKPIPLTAEILEKNGFERRKLDGGAEEFVLADDYYDITIEEWSDSIWVFRYESTEMNIPHEQRIFSYLYNLQHALRECGIDKEIVL